AAAIAEGVALVSEALPTGDTGPYQVQAAIAALHDEAPSADETDWPQIVALYKVLLRLGDNPMVALNHAAAVGMAKGPAAGLALLEGLASDRRVAEDHRFYAVRAHLQEMAGDPIAARESYDQAARRTTNVPQQRYLHARAARLAGS
ncbi:MAG TPA: RNA polymerase sigma factor, partial [Nocardioidaceae bacterium]|nr:RNA polymerase sigma factor [Nocardioidaceae bacterium]